MAIGNESWIMAREIVRAAVADENSGKITPQQWEQWDVRDRFIRHNPLTWREAWRRKYI